MEELSEYEKLRQRNIQRKMACLAEIVANFESKHSLPESRGRSQKPQQPRKKRKRKPVAKLSPAERRRSTRIGEMQLKLKRVKGFRGFKEIEHKTKKVDKVTGEETTEVEYEYVCDEIDDSDDDWDRYETVEFYDVIESDEDGESGERSGNDDDCEEPKSKKRKSSCRQTNYASLSPEEVTEAMIKKIAWGSAGKKYDSANGTSCHQCRQKTTDTKTMCRSGTCVGVRGQFCGFCLLNRYGEKPDVALKDPNWKCPPCRGLCNCSICRTRQGKAPTGILAPYVKEKGYESVSDYLINTEKDEEKPTRSIKTWKMKLVGTRE